MRERILAPSILAADFTILGEQIEQIDKAGAKYLHFDVMDGKFVPCISFGFPVLETIRKASKLVYDVHLMIEEPGRYIPEFVRLGADLVCVHLETLKNPAEELKAIKALGVKAGLAINPETPVESVYPYLEYADMVLIMTVHPGFGGQKYIDDCTAKIKSLHEEIERRGLDVDIEVDGGINEETIQTVLDAGANVIVAGSAVFNGDIEANVKKLMEKF